MPLNEALVAFLTEMHESGLKPIEESTPDEVRALLAGLKELFPAGPEMARVEDHTVAVADGGTCAVRVLAQARRRDRVRGRARRLPVGARVPLPRRR